MREDIAKTLLENLSDVLHVPEDGTWYQLSAYIKRSADGNATIQNVLAFPIRSGRTLRLIDEVGRTNAAERSESL